MVLGAGSHGLYLFTGDRHNRVLYERWGFSLIEERHVGRLTAYHLFRPAAA